ncbi:MAG: biosynthetic-type acetolactate synthase large subunit [Thiotrichales bacterium]|nr:biosynthetic-type acetolactate synthase large subunit [Thiotrichales bacterium]MBT3613706.1 biosynthetic-type acetolactate synthase large subunit [Thiotrichales bacterium]MBT3752532.1 biosynthetic-type acetolactate synthase large subunit [Thiotrichales bacterium]MBT3836690.1 biosynthetic-type acetolactate synthase large subunit [Thiotrichales bacterium]MBT4152933.1 biosynthetic-type acetolactate synthase large subunit [Thiotrichales bacterium]
MELTGAEVITHFLHDEGVEYVFGYPGGAVLHIYDALYRQDKVKHILARHEQGAVHAADGYARSCGKPGVALVTSGPGATNAVTGIATAYMDSIPLIVITGQVPTPLIGNDAFQEVDTVGITRSCVKHNFLVTDVNDLASTLKKAFVIATTGRPGPVVIDVPKDITGFKTEYSYPESVDIRSYHAVPTAPTSKIEQAVEMMLEANRPVFYTGGGVIIGNASAQLTELAHKLHIPVTNTSMGLGGFPATDDQFIGMLGMHGNYEANMAMHNTDLLIAIGARFDDRVTGNIEKFCPQAKIIHIDIDPSSISKNVQVDLPLVGGVYDILSSLLAKIGDSVEKESKQRMSSWWSDINNWRKEDCLSYKNEGGVIHPQFVLEQLYEVTNGEAFVTSDVGQHQMFAAQYYKFDKPRHWINSGGLGTMGFGLPAAIGAQFAHPDATVCTVTGDGSIQMNIQELATCQEFALPLKIINLNNGYLGMVRQWQEFFYEKRYSEVTLERNHQPDFVKLAESYGHIGMQIKDPDDVRGALEEAFAMKDRLVFMDFITNPEENVYPMVPAGAGLNEMILI